MSLNIQIRNLKAQIVATERLLDTVRDHPLMSHSLNQKIKALKEKLESLPKDLVEAKFRLLFSGDAVKGSMGIKSSFVSKTIVPIQELVKTQAALTRFGHVAKRGQSKNGASSELFLTSLPRGSFGYELSQLQTNDLFDENDVATSIKKVIRLIEATAKGDDTFEEATENIPKRSLNNLKRFFKEVSEENSVLVMESGSVNVELSASEIKEGYNRVASANTDESEIFVNGILRGFLLDSGRFEFVDEFGKHYSGLISEELTEDEVIGYDQKYLNRRCRFHLQTITTKFKTGKETTNYELLSISDSE